MRFLLWVHYLNLKVHLLFIEITEMTKRGVIKKIERGNKLFGIE